MTIESQEIKGVVLGGGKGTRLQPLTFETHKHLLPIGDKPMIFFAIEQLQQAGIRDVLLLIDERFASQFMLALRDGSGLGLRSLAYAWQSSEGKGLPTTIGQAGPFCEGKNIAVVCGDVIMESGLAKPIAEFIDNPKGARIVATEVADTAGYSPLEVVGDRVVNIPIKDPARHCAGLIDLGAYLYTSGVFEEVRQLQPSARGETEIWDLNMRYARRQELRCSIIDGWWSDVGGSLEKYQEANRRYSTKGV